MSECAIYRYVYNDKVIYVGKTDHNLKNRIKCHAQEKRFWPYLGKVKIEYFRVNNHAETVFWETYLINKYHAILNSSMNYPNTVFPEIDVPKWLPYVPAKHKINRRRFYENSDNWANSFKRETVQVCEPIKPQSHNEKRDVVSNNYDCNFPANFNPFVSDI